MVLKNKDIYIYVPGADPGGAAPAPTPTPIQKRIGVTGLTIA